MASEVDAIQSVKDYLVKYNLEDDLSAAVNHAIKQNSDDPHRIIAEWMMKLAKVSLRTLFAAHPLPLFPCLARC